MKLAQWVGRGVRTETIWSVIAVCDTRLTTMRYGQAILARAATFSGGTCGDRSLRNIRKTLLALTTHLNLSSLNELNSPAHATSVII